MYAFVDTVESGGGDALLPSEALKFNGEYLEQRIRGYRTLSVSGREMLNAELEELAVGSKNGSEYLYKRYPPRDITVQFQITASSASMLQERFNELNKILDVENAVLVFRDEQDKYFVGTKSAVSLPDEGRTSTVGKFVLHCPDPFKYAVAEKEFLAGFTSDGVLTAYIVNGGSVPVAIDYFIKHYHDNGYIGIVSDDGVIQYGRVEECDVQQGNKSEMLVDLSGYAGLNAMASGGGVQDANNQYPLNGSFRAVTREGIQYLALDNVGSGGAWHGASKSVTLPADSNGEVGAVNFYLESRFWFNTDKVPQTGALELVVGDANGRHVASIHVVKSTTAANQCSAVFQINGTEAGRIKYEPGYWSVTGNDRKPVYIRKSGELFEFCFGGKKYQYRNPAMAGVKAVSVTLLYLQYGTRGAVNLVTKMFAEYLRFRKDDVAFWYDVPNRYASGDELYVDGSESKLFVNGIASLDDEILGSRYFKAGPGMTKVEFYYSGFSNPAPEVKVRIREAWI
ncbi:MAG: phage tail family protein [Dorea sp.]|nr:phage tail family protein [Dorea sp.]